MAKFPRQKMVDALDEGPVEDEIVGHGRWTVRHSAVLKIDGKFYQTTYSVGATEQQDERPWEYEKDVECVEVEQVTRLVEVTSWEPVA
jgi:hypothetical protein